MKRTLSVLLVLLAVTVSTQAKTRVVEAPRYLYSSTTMLEIARVTLSDTATIVDFDIYHTPNKNIRILKTLALYDEAGMRYAFRSCEGMTPGKRVRMPESGKLSLSLVFEPLPVKTRSFDFVEGPGEDDWRFAGISTTGKLPRPKEIKQLEKLRKKNTPTLPDVKFSGDSAIVTGRFIGAKYLDRHHLRLIYNSPFTGDQLTEEGIVHGDTFRIAVPAYVPSEVFLYTAGLGYTPRFCIVPGEETHIDFNLTEMSLRNSRLLKKYAGKEQAYYFSGAMAGVNQEMADDTLNVRRFWQSYRSLRQKELYELYGLTTEGYKQYMLHLRDSVAAEIERQSWSEEMKALNHMRNDVYGVYLINRYRLSLRLSHREHFPGPKSIATLIFTQELQLPDKAEFFNYLALLKPYFENGTITLSEEFGDVINSIIDVKLFRRKICNDIFSFAQQQDTLRGYFLSPEEREYVHAIVQRGGYNTLTDSEKEEAWKFLDKYASKLQLFSAYIVSNEVDFVDPYYDKECAYFDWQKMQYLYEELKENYSPLDSADFASLQAIANPEVTRVFTRMNDELLALRKRNSAASQRVDAPIDSLRGEALFSALVAPDRGKVVLVDKWETWCGPCRTAMQEMKPVKEALAGQDIAYLYLVTEGSSDKEKWETMTQAIPGRHIMLSPEQAQSLSVLLESTGVPTFIIVDREGNRIKKITGWGGTDEMKQELLKALKK